MNTSINLNVVSWSCVHFLDASSTDALKREIDEKKIFLAELDADFIRDDAGLFSCLSDALEFPDYFGENWDALDECIVDIDLPDLQQGQ